MIRFYFKATLLRSVSISILLSFALGTVANASVKERGGGNITSGGELADLEFVRSATPITTEATQLLDQALTHLLPLAPDFAALFFTTGLDGKETQYYLTTHEIKDSECALKAPVSINATIAACNLKMSETLSEVYINATVWKKASAKDRLDLLLHEQLRSHQLRVGAANDIALFRLTESVSRFVALATTSQATLSQKEAAAREMLQISLRGGLGAFDLGLTIHALTDAAVVTFSEACKNPVAAWPTTQLSVAGAPLFAALLDQSLNRQLFSENRAAFCASLRLETEKAISGYRGQSDVLYPLYWR